jgi:AcrR family transcriptional regulator
VTQGTDSPSTGVRAGQSTRADAVRNRRRVEQAAAEVFAEQGMNATVADVAERAGVGNATVYRTFPAKADLLAQVSINWLSTMETVAQRLATAAETAPVGAFRSLIAELFDRLRGDRLAVDLLRAGDLTDEVAVVRHRVEGHVTEVLRRAQAADGVRPDLTYSDLHVLVMGLAGRLAEMGIVDEDRWTKTAELALTGALG